MAADSRSAWADHDVSAFLITPMFNKTSKPSFVWHHFGELVFKEGDKRSKIKTDRVFCNACLKKAQGNCGDNQDPDEPSAHTPFKKAFITDYSATVSTSNLATHLLNAHDIKDPQEMLSAQSDLRNIFAPVRRQTGSETSAARKSALARDLAVMIARDLVAFEKVKGEGFVDFLKKYKIIQNESELPDPRTLARSALQDVYIAMREFITEHIAKGPRFGAITLDLWTDRYRRRHYITFTFHQITAQFKLESFTLSTHLVKGKHTGEAICEQIGLLKDKFGLHTKTLHSTTDRGSNMIKGTELADIENESCIGHGLHNLVMEDGIRKVKRVDDLVRKLCGVLKKVRYHSMAIEEERIQEEIDAVHALEDVVETLGSDEFEETSDEANIGVVSQSEGGEDDATDCRESEPSEGVQSAGRAHVSLKTFTKTRWHALLFLIESLLACKTALIKVTRKIQCPYVITTVEWELLEDLMRFLKTLKLSVELLSSESTPTVNIALILRAEIKAAISTKPDKPVIKKMKESMLANFDRRFPVTELLVCGALLDPRCHELNDVVGFFADHESTKDVFLADTISKMVRASDLPVVEDSSQSSPLESPSSEENVVDQLARKHSRLSRENERISQIERECQKFLATAKPEDVKHGDILEYWRKSEAQYPWLSTLARFVLAVPATSTPSERVFSVAGLVVTAKTSSLSPVTVNELIFVHDNYKFCKSVIN